MFDVSSGMSKQFENFVLEVTTLISREFNPNLLSRTNYIPVPNAKPYPQTPALAPLLQPPSQSALLTQWTSFDNTDTAQLILELPVKDIPTTPSPRTASRRSTFLKPKCPRSSTFPALQATGGDLSILI